MATGLVGLIGEFDCTAEDIAAYIERLEMYIIANDITEGKKMSVLLAVVGAMTYSWLQIFLAPNFNTSNEELGSCRQTKGTLQYQTAHHFRV